MAKNGGETIIAQGVRVEGDFIAEGDIIIEGEVRGTITTTGDLRVGETARLEGTISARNATIAGEVRGTMKVSGRLELLPSSKFAGEVGMDVLSVGAGAQVNGMLRMGPEEEMPKMSRGRKGQVSPESEE